MGVLMVATGVVRMKMIPRGVMMAVVGMMVMGSRVMLAQEGATRMRIQILPEDGMVDGGEASEVLERLREAVAVGQDGTSGVDEFSLLATSGRRR